MKDSSFWEYLMSYLSNEELDNIDKYYRRNTSNFDDLETRYYDLVSDIKEAISEVDLE